MSQYLAGNAALGPNQGGFSLTPSNPYFWELSFANSPCYQGAYDCYESPKGNHEYCNPFWTTGVYPGLTTARQGSGTIQYNVQVGLPWAGG